MSIMASKTVIVNVYAINNSLQLTVTVDGISSLMTSKTVHPPNPVSKCLPSRPTCLDGLKTLGYTLSVTITALGSKLDLKAEIVAGGLFEFRP